MNEQGFLDVFTWIILLTLLTYLSRELEIWKMVNEIETYIAAYRSIRDKAIKTAINAFKEVALKRSSSIDLRVVESRIRAFIETEIIEPTSKDPFGIIQKIKHIVRTSDEALGKEIARLLPSATKVEIENLKDLVGSARALNSIYKVVDHIYRIGRRFKSLWILMQLNALLPFITEDVKALESSLEAFSNGYPIGDSAGPILAAKFLRKYGRDSKIVEVARDTLVAEVPFKDRKVLVVKAKGPAGVLGRLDDAVSYLLSVYKNVSMIVTVDASLKLESEESGAISEGFGVAIGGTEVEKFNIEKLATEMNIPLYAILIKMSEIEAMSVISKKLFEAVDRALLSVEKVIEERTHPGDCVILVGVGNTIGVTP